MGIEKRLEVILELERIKSEQRLSQQQLADKVGVTQPTVSAWLSREDLPSASSLRKIKNAFPELTTLVVQAALEAVLSDQADAAA